MKLLFEKLLFFTINLHFVISNQLPIYRKLNFPLSSGIYLVFLHSRNARKTQADQSVPHIFLLSLKRNKPLKVAAAQTLFSSVYVIGTTCFDDCFLMTTCK